MDTFSISQLEQFSGIKAHTIRIWEQRYNALKPHRSEGNTRYYDNSQLKRLLNIVSLMNSEYKISEICSMPDEKLFKIINHQLANTISDTSMDHHIFQLLSGGMRYDEVYMDKIFTNCVKAYGLKSTYIEIIYPLLIRIGLMWTNETIPPEQEHFISNFIRQKLFTAIDSLSPVNSSKNSWLLFLPENEFHEIGLLFGNYIIRASHKQVTYLGANVPLQTLTNAVTEIKPENLFFFFVRNNIPENSQKYINTLIKTFKNIKLHISGNPELINKLKLKEIKWLHSVELLQSEVK